MLKKCAGLLCVLGVLCLLLLPVFGDDQDNRVGPAFRADYVFKGASLPSGWKTIGKATWKAQDGKITGTATDSSGGWLVLDKSFQNVVVYSNVHCAEGCKAGVLLRAQKTPDGGLKGVFTSLAQNDLNSYAIMLDAQGKEVSREKLPPPNPEVQAQRGALNPNLSIEQQIGVPGAGGRGAGGGGVRVVPVPAGVELPESLKPTVAAYKIGSSNEFDIRAFDNDLNVRINGGNLGGGGSTMNGSIDEGLKYGTIALYVGGTGHAEFDGFRYKDLNLIDEPKETVSKNFRMQHIDGLYFSWSAQIADVNHDGINDVIAGPYYFLGPNFDKAHQIYKPVSYNPAFDYPQVSMVSLAYDFTGDGWPDVLVMSGNAGNGAGRLYVNPKGESRYWDNYLVLPHVGNEETHHEGY